MFAPCARVYIPRRETARKRGISGSWCVVACSPMEGSTNPHEMPRRVRVHGPRVRAVQQRRRCCSMNADPDDIGPEATRASHYQLSYPLRSKEVGDKNLGQSAYRTPKGERDQSMPVKREQVRSASSTSRKTRVTGSRLDCLKPNRDRGSLTPSLRMDPRS